VQEYANEVSRCLASFQTFESSSLGPQPDHDVAQFIVNNIRELPGHYAYHRFWSRFSDELMQFRKGSRFEEADRAGAELKRSNDSLAAELIKVRSGLAEEYDIPWAPYYDESMVLPSR